MQFNCVYMSIFVVVAMWRKNRGRRQGTAEGNFVSIITATSIHALGANMALTVAKKLHSLLKYGASRYLVESSYLNLLVALLHNRNPRIYKPLSNREFGHQVPPPKVHQYHTASSLNQVHVSELAKGNPPHSSPYLWAPIHTNHLIITSVESQGMHQVRT